MADYADIITTSELMELHARSIQEFGGDTTQRQSDADCIKGVISASVNGANYMRQGDGIDSMHMAACLLFYAAKRHCFVDGNKRIAWILGYCPRDALQVLSSFLHLAVLLGL